MDRNMKLLGSFLINIFIAPVTISKVAGIIYKTSSSRRKFTSFHLILPLLFGGFAIFGTLQCFGFTWAWAIALYMYLSFCGCVATIRTHARQKYQISGHFVEDFTSTLVLYPSVAVQLKMVLEKDVEKGSNAHIYDSPI